MPNGKPFDHPITDIVHHGRTVFGDEADGLIREVVALGGNDELSREPWIWSSPPLADQQVERLRQLRDRLRSEQPADDGAGDDATS